MNTQHIFPGAATPVRKPNLLVADIMGHQHMHVYVRFSFFIFFATTPSRACMFDYDSFFFRGNFLRYMSGLFLFFFKLWTRLKILTMHVKQLYGPCSPRIYLVWILYRVKSVLNRTTVHNYVTVNLLIILAVKFRSNCQNN
jgi:hypothetical protein